MDSIDKLKKKLEKIMRNLDKTENSIFSKHNVSDASKEEINRIQGSAEKKYQGGTDAGKQRKTRIVNKHVLNHRHVSLLTSIYDSVLPLFRSYVMLFQLLSTKYIMSKSMWSGLSCRTSPNLRC